MDRKREVPDEKEKKQGLAGCFITPRYDKRWEAYLTHTHQEFLSHLKTQDKHKILDASCGTGLLAEHLVTEQYPFHRLILNDISKDMLEIAQRRLQHHLNITFHNQPTERLAFPRSTFDIICCLNAFHYYQHQQTVLDKFYNYLKPGGKLYLLDWNNSGWFRLVNWIIDQWSSEYIDSCSLAETIRLLEKADLSPVHESSWYWRYWKFYYVIAQKPQ